MIYENLKEKFCRNRAGVWREGWSESTTVSNEEENNINFKLLQHSTLLTSSIHSTASACDTYTTGPPPPSPTRTTSTINYIVYTTKWIVVCVGVYVEWNGDMECDQRIINKPAGIRNSQDNCNIGTHEPASWCLLLFSHSAIASGPLNVLLVFILNADIFIKERNMKMNKKENSFRTTNNKLWQKRNKHKVYTPFFLSFFRSFFLYLLFCWKFLSSSLRWLVYLFISMFFY